MSFSNTMLIIWSKLSIRLVNIVGDGLSKCKVDKNPETMLEGDAENIFAMFIRVAEKGQYELGWRMIGRIWTCTPGILIRLMIAMKCRIMEEELY